VRRVRLPHLIKIDRDSIRVNPNAGKDFIDILGRKRESKTIIKKDTIEYYQDGLLTGQMSNTLNLPESITITQTQDIQRLFTLSPEPKYLYKYESPELECEYCYERFYYSELEDRFDDFTDQIYDDCCPHCKVAYCCKYELEKLTNEELGSYVA